MHTVRQLSYRVRRRYELAKDRGGQTTMARITVSLPDDLEAQLEQYAQQHSTNASQVVQTALRNLFASPAPTPHPPPAPAPTPPSPPMPELSVVQDYLTQLVYKMELMREGLWDMSQLICHGAPCPTEIPCPKEIPLPPWPHQPPPGWGTGNPDTW